MEWDVVSQEERTLWRISGRCYVMDALVMELSPRVDTKPQLGIIPVTIAKEQYENPHSWVQLVSLDRIISGPDKISRSTMTVAFLYKRIRHDSMPLSFLSPQKRQRVWTRHSACCLRLHMKLSKMVGSWSLPDFALTLKSTRLNM